MTGTDVSTATATLPFHSIGELSVLIATRQISPVDVVTTLLSRIERLNSTLASYITVCAAEAVAAARAAERDIIHGKYRGPLHGIPIAYKDIIWTKGVRTTAHSRALADFVPAEDATHVHRLSAAGMILIGKTNTGEFACGTSELFGNPRNPWSLNHYTGGSSNGSANAVASLTEAVGDLLQELIARQMTQSIVDIFEAVQVDDTERERPAVTFGHAGRLRQSVLEQQAVWKTGESVVERLV